jgi:hypothetical protein
MEVSITRKLFSFFVTFVLIYLCKYSYYHQTIAVTAPKVATYTATPLTQTVIPAPPKTENKTASTTKLAKPTVNKMQYSKDAEVHAIGVYEASKSENLASWANCGSLETSANTCSVEMANRKGSVKINISASAHPIILVLMSYESVIWDLNISKNVNVEQIILGGYYAQEITGLKNNVPIITYTHYPSPCTNCFHAEGYFYSYTLQNSEFINKIFTITGKEVSSFQGGYKASDFNVMDNMPRLEYQHAARK